MFYSRANGRRIERAVVLDSDVVLTGLASEDEPLLSVPSNAFTGRDSRLVKCLDLRSLLSDFPGFCERAVGWYRLAP